MGLKSTLAARQAAMKAKWRPPSKRKPARVFTETELRRIQWLRARKWAIKDLAACFQTSTKRIHEILRGEYK